jgi:hypothetical protein
VNHPVACCENEDSSDACEELQDVCYVGVSTSRVSSILTEDSVGPVNGALSALGRRGRGSWRSHMTNRDQEIVNRAIHDLIQRLDSGAYVGVMLW